MTSPDRIVCLFDVDNTLLDNDTMETELGERLLRDFGAASRDRYWELFEALRRELDYADYLGTLQHYRAEHPEDPNLFLLSSFLMDYPFADRLYQGALDVLARLSVWGPTVILTDGDVVYQPRKIQRAGLWDAVRGRVLIFLHKERKLDQIARRYPASHYIMVDDKPPILAAIKRQWRDRVTTVFARQGHYARGHDANAVDPAPDVSLDEIGALAGYDLDALRAAARAGGAPDDVS
jgi:FMN phosphatase YigB (HAD superfamily)